MPKTQINWGIIGCGDVCEIKSGPAFYKVPGSNLYMVMRRDKQKVIDFAHRHGVQNYCTNADELINNEHIDAVYIATPPNTHAEYAIKAMQACKAVYVEKPMALNYQQCMEMINVSKETGNTLFVAYYRRFFPYFLKIKELIDSDKIGKTLTISLTTAIPPRESDFDKTNPHWHLIPEIAGGGYFFDVACHQLDILDFLCGPVEDAHGFFTNRAGIYQVEDTLAAALKFKSGILGTCNWTYVSETKSAVNRIEIFGIKGSITFSIEANEPIVLKTAVEQQHFDYQKPYHVEMPMIEQVTMSLLGKSNLKSNMEDAARTSWVMDKIMNS